MGTHSGQDSSKEAGEEWNWDEKSLTSECRSDHNVTLFDLCSPETGLDLRTIKVGSVPSFNIFDFFIFVNNYNISSNLFSYH